MRVPTIKWQHKLAVLWFLGVGITALLLVIQSIMDVYHNRTEEAWSWFLPLTMPTLGLIVGVIVMQEKKGGRNENTSDLFTFRMAFSLSFAYLLVLLGTILSQPVSPLPQLELLNLSNFWLGPFQSIIGAAIGAFFVR